MLNSKLFEFSYNSIIDGLFKKNKKVSREEVSKKKKRQMRKISLKIEREREREKKKQSKTKQRDPKEQ